MLNDVSLFDEPFFDKDSQYYKLFFDNGIFKVACFTDDSLYDIYMRRIDSALKTGRYCTESYIPHLRGEIDRFVALLRCKYLGIDVDFPLDLNNNVEFEEILKGSKDKPELGQYSFKYSNDGPFFGSWEHPYEKRSYEYYFFDFDIYALGLSQSQIKTLIDYLGIHAKFDPDDLASKSYFDVFLDIISEYEKYPGLDSTLNLIVRSFVNKYGTAFQCGAYDCLRLCRLEDGKSK